MLMSDEGVEDDALSVAKEWDNLRKKTKTKKRLTACRQSSSKLKFDYHLKKAKSISYGSRNWH